MAERVAYLEAVFGADVTAFRRGTTQVRRDLNLLSDTADGLSKAGRNMTLMVSTPIVALGTAAGKMAMDFDAAMQNVRSILFDVTNEDFNNLSAATLDWGANIRSGPLSAAEALYTVVSAGYTEIEDAMNIAQVATLTAEAGLADLTTTAEALSAAMLAYGADTEDAAHYGDVLTRAVQVGVGEMQEFATGIGNATAAASMLGVSFDELGGTQAFLTQRGMGAAKAATMLNRAYEKLITPTDEMRAVFQQLGVTTGRDLITQFGGFEGALGAIHDVIGDDSEALHELFNTTQAFKAVGPIFNEFDAYAASMADFREAVVGATEAAHEQQMMSWAAQFDLLNSAVQAAGITIGNTFMPVLMPMVNNLREAFLALLDVNPEFIALGVAMAGAVAAVGPILWALGSMLSPIGLLVGAVTGLSTAFALDFGGIRTTVSEAMDDILGDLTPVKEALSGFLSSIFGTGDQPPLTMDDLWVSDPAAEKAIQLEISTTLWDAFLAAGGEAALGAWPEFRDTFIAETGRDPLTLQAGEIFTLGGTEESSLAMRNEVMAEVAAAEDYAAAHSTFGSRLATAWVTQWPKLETAITDLTSKIKTWIETELPPKLNAALTNVFNSIGTFFSGIEGGGLYGALVNLFEVDGPAALSEIGRIMKEHFPEASASFNTMLSSFGTFLADTAVPELARIGGYLSGKIALALWDGLKAGIAFVGSLLTGGGRGAAGVFSKSVMDPFVVGFEDAIAGTDFEGKFSSFGIKVVGAIVTAIGVAAVAPGIFGPIASKIGLSIGSSLASGSMSLGAAATTALPGKLTAALSSVLGVGATGLLSIALAGISVLTIGAILFSEDARNTIAQGTRSFLTNTVGVTTDEFWANWDEGVNKALEAPITIGVLRDEVGQAQGLSQYLSTGDLDPEVLQQFADQMVRVNAGLELAKSLDLGTGGLMSLFGWDQTSDQRGGLEGDVAALQAHFDALVASGVMDEVLAKTQEISDVVGANSFTGAGGGETADVSGGGFYNQETALMDQANLQATGDMLGAEGALQVGFVGAQSASSDFRIGTEADMAAVSTKLVEVSTNAGEAAAKLNAMAGTYTITIITRHVTEGSPSGYSADAELGIDGARASGGPVRAGGTYLVGERGPELLQMGSHSGNIVANDAVVGGGVSTTNKIYIDGKQDVDTLLWELERRGVYLGA